MTKPFYSEWTKEQILALVLDGIRRGKIKDQTILHKGGSDSVALSEIIRQAILIKSA